MDEPKFTWVPFYEEFAQKLLSYKDAGKRPELVAKIKELDAEWIKFIKSPAKDNDFDDIDPFTIFGIFNRSSKVEKRKSIIKSLKAKFDIEASVPEDFNGIPILNPQKSCFYYEDEKSETIPLLWNLFGAFINNDKQLIAGLFDEAQKKKGIKWNLTMAFFWMKPLEYCPMDRLSRNFLNHESGKTIDDSRISYSVYQDASDAVVKLCNSDKEYKSIYEFSNSAFEYAINRQNIWIVGGSWDGQSHVKEFYENNYWEGGPGNSSAQLKCLNGVKKGDFIALKTRDGGIPSGVSGDLKILHVGIAAEDSKALDDEKWFTFKVNWFTDYQETVYPKMYKKPYNGTIGKCTHKKIMSDLIEFISEGSLKMTESNNNTQQIVDLLLNNYNIVLHGAPGTGKTYLAKQVAKKLIFPNKDIDVELSAEEEKQFNEQCGFVQFHQSYDYTDFVEGLRPVNQESNQIGFERKDGVFKEFCIKAMIKSSSDSKTTGKLNSNPVVWKVSLAGTGDNPIRQDCLENGYIRIGWKEYGDVENFNDFDNYINGGKNVLRAFQNEMKEGDIVVSCFSENETDAIGIVTGSYNYDEIRFGDYPRFRNVEWLVKNIKEDIVAINNNRKFTLSTIYKSNITAEDAIKIVNKHKTSISLNDRPFVFIIDEINRGEMSKIFGELFFSIDPGYRGEIGRIKTQYQNLVPNGDVFAKGFFVPKNVYIIGTMNDIDRSVESMDFAMRRRFAFMEIKAKDRIAMLKDSVNGIGECADEAEKRMNALNETIGSEAVGLSHAYDIGPAYFLKLKDCDYSFDKLWDYHIKGLVKEYLRGMDENGEKFKALKDAYFHSETNAPKKEESESK